MALPRDLIELFAAFAEAGVRYLLVGGHAVAAHGRPRSTKDVDLWLAPDIENVERACTALAGFGVPRELVESLRHSGPEDIVWLGRAPLRVDLLRSLPAVDFERAWPRRVVVTLERVAVPVIGKEDLIRNKQAVGRPQDRRDVRALGGAEPRPSAKARSGATKVPSAKARDGATKVPSAKAGGGVKKKPSSNTS